MFAQHEEGGSDIIVQLRFLEMLYLIPQFYSLDEWVKALPRETHTHNSLNITCISE